MLAKRKGAHFPAMPWSGSEQPSFMVRTPAPLQCSSISSGYPSLSMSRRRPSGPLYVSAIAFSARAR